LTDIRIDTETRK